MVIVSITPEIALEGSRIFAGGLGVLEGDKLYGAGDMGLDYVALSLFYRHGYVSISFQGLQPSLGPERQEKSFLEKLTPEEEFVVTLKGNEVIVRPWVYRYKTAKAVLFEAVCPQWARKLTERVYLEDGMEETFLKYALLAKAASHYIRNVIGLENISVVDLEESYTALILNTLDLADRARIIIHTPGPWGHPGFPGEFIAREFGLFLGDYVSLSEYALSRLKSAIVVSKKQEDVVGKIFPAHAGKFRGITNGIYLPRWMHPELYKAWRQGVFQREILVKARSESRGRLLSLIRSVKSNVNADGRIIVAWTRRLARYKRPYFAARFIEENPDVNAFFILAGKPHPRDNDGLGYLKKFRELDLKLANTVYLQDYNIETARLIAQGSDLWLFTPFSGWEACGTSFMKAQVNGVPVLSSRDGGALEIIEDGVTGWLFGQDLRDFTNIYTDPRAGEIDEREYQEFRNKLLWIIDMYQSDPEKYLEISMNAWMKTPGKVDIAGVLKKYYFETTT
ncbi:glycogen/starch/alpha-glucan phosphorylase [Desulfurococcus mucosus]|uniref:glycogen/starch/alpha-glucan phosphorylase n=1 Tax=Desulfurococcus mucosus TaxID=2275 RepID=UPI000662B8D5|nr:glycogen/starch/alpha-glucan phosphorylase [Desulfurococcus mucosus]